MPARRWRGSKAALSFCPMELRVWQTVGSDRARGTVQSREEGFRGRRQVARGAGRGQGLQREPRPFPSTYQSQELVNVLHPGTLFWSHLFLSSHKLSLKEK